MLRMRSLLLAGACLFAASLTQAADNPATPKPALDNKVIRVGTAADYPPLTMQNEGQVRGIEADLAAELGKRTGHHYQFKIIPWSGLFNAVGRFVGAMPESTTFAILFMNGLAPLIDRMSRPRTFGWVKRDA